MANSCKCSPAPGGSVHRNRTQVRARGAQRGRRGSRGRPVGRMAEGRYPMAVREAGGVRQRPVEPAAHRREREQAEGRIRCGQLLPPTRSYRCTYVAQQAAVKTKYELWVTEAEKEAMLRVLGTCPELDVPPPGPSRPSRPTRSGRPRTAKATTKPGESSPLTSSIPSSGPAAKPTMPDTVPTTRARTPSTTGIRTAIEMVPSASRSGPPVRCRSPQTRPRSGCTTDSARPTGARAASRLASRAHPGRCP